MSEIIEKKEKIDEEGKGLDNNIGSNNRVLDIINHTSENVIKILIPENYIVSRIINNIVSNLNIINDGVIIRLVQLIKKYINKRTEFYYDQSNREVIGLVLEGHKLKKLFEELVILKVEDECFQEIKEVNKARIEKIEQINKVGISINEIDKNLYKLNQRLFQLENRLALLEDKGKTDENIYHNLISIKSNLSILLTNKENLSSKKVDLEDMIRKIYKVLEKLEEYKRYEINERIENTYNGFFYFSFSYELKEIKSKKDKKNEDKSYRLGNIGKNVIYSLAFLTGIVFSIQANNDRNKNINVDEKFSKSVSLQNKVPEYILNQVSKGFPRKISGFEDFFIIGTDTYPLEVPYKGKTLAEDIILNKIKLTFLDIKGLKKPPIIVNTYFYRRDITNKVFTIIVKDASAEGQTINLSIKEPK